MTRKMKKPTDTNLKEAWLDYKAENYPDEDWAEIVNPVRAAFEAGWDDAVSYMLVNNKER